MKNLRLGSMLMMMFMSLIASAVRVAAEAEVTIPNLVISEVQVASEVSASDEFVEVYNAGSTNTYEGVYIQYRSASGESWSTKAQALLALMPGDRFLFSSGVVDRDSDAELKSGLAGGGGHIRLIVINGEVEIELDRLGWGSAVEPEGSASPAPSERQSLKRVFDEDGLIIDTDDNMNDFLASDSPNPQYSSYSFNPAPEPEPEVEPIPEPAPAPEPTPIPGPVPQPEIHPDLVITELLANPGSPKLDKDDEFVEIYNPNDMTVDLDGYILQTGHDNDYTYSLPAYELGPGRYLAIYSKDSGLTLTNSSGKSRLLRPNLETTSETDVYENAKDDMAWALIDGSWQWTDQVTPGQANLAIVENDEPAASITGSSLKASLSNPATAENILRNIYEEPQTVESQQLSYTTLVVMAVIAILYFVYEYRQEITGAGRKLGRHFKAWRANR